MMPLAVVLRRRASLCSRLPVSQRSAHRRKVGASAAATSASTRGSSCRQSVMSDALYQPRSQPSQAGHSAQGGHFEECSVMTLAASVVRLEERHPSHVRHDERLCADARKTRAHVEGSERGPQCALANCGASGTWHSTSLKGESGILAAWVMTGTTQHRHPPRPPRPACSPSTPRPPRPPRRPRTPPS